MSAKSIYSKLNNINRRKFYLTLTLVLLSSFSVIFINQISSPYATNSFAAGTPSSVSYPVHLAYFYEVGCHDCDKAKIILKDISEKYPENLILKSFDINITENMELAESLGELNQMPEEERLLVPVLFIGDDYLFRDAITFDNLDKLIQKYSTLPGKKLRKKTLQLKID